MDGYTLSEKLRKARRRYVFSAGAQALFYELIAICNDDSWPDIFKCGSGELCSALTCTEKTLTNYRDELIASNLIGYLSGKSKRETSSYSLNGSIVGGMNDISNGDTNGSKNYHSSEHQSDSHSIEKTPDNNKEFNKKKSKKQTKKNITPADAVGVEHFNHLKKYFTDFYNLKFSPEEYYHDGKEAAATKNLVKKITFGVAEKCKKRNQVFTPELIPAAIEVFITGAYEYGSTFIRQNFTLNTLYSKYGEVVIQISTQANNMGKSKTATSASKVENVINIATAATYQEQQEA